MPDQKMKELCAKIAAEKDPARMIQLTNELMKLLEREQAAIRENIRAQMSRHAGDSF